MHTVLQEGEGRITGGFEEELLTGITHHVKPHFGN